MLGGRAIGPLIVNKKILQHFSLKRKESKEDFMKHLSKIAVIFTTLFLTCIFMGCSNDASPNDASPNDGNSQNTEVKKNSLLGFLIRSICRYSNMESI